MFDKILIANRGEIACRVATTARRLGIRTVAVYSDADAQAKHVAVCDEAYRLGPAPAKDSYLRADRILEIAKACGAQAIHPGYGFLSENEEFAQAVADAGLVFIGPPASAIAAMGSKSAAKALMEKAAVPLVPGYHGADQDPEMLAREAERAGYPVLIKASAGGGGKGMRIVEKAADFAAALASCKREAKNSFGDDAVLIERYVTRPRHIEIQVFGDSHGECVYLFERDCSVQRRHQKVIEEAPAPGMTDARRRAMGEAAVAAAKAVGYVGAGTVEFIADQDGNFFFMEMNTRLQVEHPVTEMITGVDLVEWQFRVAAGERLPHTQDELRIRGHAIEARVYAENADKGFLPSTGRLAHLRMPEAEHFGHVADGQQAQEGAAAAAEPVPIRIDSGVREGDSITPFYDPMIAKLIVWGVDRAHAIARMSQALAHFEVAGPTTNVDFLGRLMKCRAFREADLDTALIERERPALFPKNVPVPASMLAIAAATILSREAASPPPAGAIGRTPSPWAHTGGWRLNAGGSRSMTLTAGPETHALRIDYLPNGWTVQVGDESIPVTDVRDDGRRIAGLAGGLAFDLTVVTQGESVMVFTAGRRIVLGCPNPLEHAGDDAAEGGSLAAPMPGKVIALLVAKGAKVSKGQPLVVMEAMKMEHTITAPSAGEVTDLPYAAGDQVAEGAALVAFAPAG